MKKNFKAYALLALILFAVFNAAAFLVRPIIPGFGIAYDARFWVAWAAITAAFAGNVLCAWFVFSAKNLNKMFYSLPLITVSRTALIVTLAAGVVLMLIPDCPAWIAAIVCILILGFHALALVKAQWAAETVAAVDEKVKAQTFFVKSLTVDAESLTARAGTPEAKTACRKVYEAIRYSDPMSNEALAEIEGRISLKFNEFSAAVTEGSDAVGTLAEELVNLAGDRNRKCKMLK